MDGDLSTIDNLCLILCKAAKHVLESGTQRPINYSKTIQDVPRISLKPAIGCFVQFTGDYNGLAVINLTEEASMDIYKNYMTSMGLPENELARDYTSNEVADSIGEITNQIMALMMRMVKDRYDLTSICGQPKALAMNFPVILTIDSTYKENRRMVFNIDGTKNFHMELAMEKTQFIIANKR